MYQLRYAKGVIAAIKRLPDDVRADIIEIISDLALDPKPPDSIDLREPYLGHNRIAIGRYRIIYKVYEEEQRVVIWAVKKRRPSTYTYLTQS